MFGELNINQQHLKMNKKILISIIGILLIATILASEITINNFTKDKIINKDIRDYLLTKTNEDKISLDIEISCSKDSCLWSAKQKGIIDSKDNFIKKDYSYCSKYKKEDGYNICVEKKIKHFNNEEMEDLINDLITKRINDYAEKEMNKEIYVKSSIGNLELKEKVIKDVED